MPLRPCLLAALVAVSALMHSTAAQGQTDKTLLDPKNAGTCVNRFNTLIANLYTNTNSTALQQCGVRLNQAFNSTSPSQCPAGDTPPVQPGQPTHFCMNQNGSQPYLDAWTGIIRDCELMYIAFRTGSGESEEGLVSYDNTCFPQFKSFSEFQTWLNNAQPYGGSSSTFNAAGALRPYIAAAIAAVALVLSLVW